VILGKTNKRQQVGRIFSVYTFVGLPQALTANTFCPDRSSNHQGLLDGSTREVDLMYIPNAYLLAIRNEWLAKYSQQKQKADPGAGMAQTTREGMLQTSRCPSKVLVKECVLLLGLRQLCRRGFT
jgi:hypothetical protein